MLSSRTCQYRRDEEWVSIPVVLHSILHSQILLQGSQAPLQPFPARSNSFKQEICEEKSPTTICRYPNHFALAAFVSITIVLSQDSPNLCQWHWRFLQCHPCHSHYHWGRFPAKLSSGVWGKVGTRAGVWQPALGIIYTLSQGCTSQVLCVAGKAAVTGAGCQCLTRVVQG